MKQRIPNPKILCCASIFALSLAACSNQPKTKTDVNLGDNGNGATNHIVKLKKGHRSKKLGLPLPDPRSYDNLWDRLFDRFDLPAVSHQDVDRELNWFISHPAYIERVQSRAEPFLYSIVKQLEKHNMPGELALLPVIESAFQPHVVSPAHAAGIWQFIPATGRHYGLKQSHSYDGRRDIYASTHAAIKYLKKLHNDFNGDWLLAIAGYNCGEGAVSRAIQRNAVRGLPTDFWSLDLPQETRSYVPRLLAVAKLFSESEQYGFSLRPIPNKALYKTVKMNRQVDLAMAANAADISLERLFELNPGFKRQYVDLDGSYRLFIPAHKKIVDFKEDLARQMAVGQESDPQRTAYTGQADLKSAANSVIETASPASEAMALPPESPTVGQLVQGSRLEAASAPQTAVPGSSVQPEEPLQQRSTFQKTQLPESRVAFVSSDLSQPTQDSSVENSASAIGDKTTTFQNAIVEDSQENVKDMVPRKARLERQADPSMDSALKLMDYERAAAASAKGVASTRQSMAKPNPKGQEQFAPGERSKAFEHDPSASALHEKSSAKDKIDNPRDRDNLPYERHTGEAENSGKKSAYRVQEGDTLYSIARKHDMDVDELKKLNHISQADDINYGRMLVVPSKEAGKKPPAAKTGTAGKSSQITKYTAHDGETLFSISRRFNVTVADLRKWNGIKEDKQFRAGMNITVSGERD